jgi:hypothetical protein
MNQTEIRFFVSTMNAVEAAIPDRLGIAAEFDDATESLIDLLNHDDKINKESRKIIKDAIDRFTDIYGDIHSNLEKLETELYLLVPTEMDNQAWRYEPYPWLGAPASPLLPLFDLTGA